MKKLFKTLAIVLLASATTFAATVADNDKELVSKPTTFAIGMYNVKNTTKVRVMLEKASAEVLAITLKNEEGNVIYREFMSKKQHFYNTNFELKNLPDGNYIIEVEGEKEKVVREITIDTQAPKPTVYKEISLN